MKTISHIILTSVLMIMIGCQKSPTDSKESSDDWLIEAIMSADKTEISISQLPSESQYVINEDYDDYTDVDAGFASGLGYEVTMGGSGDKMGRYSDLYFNMEGRRLNGKRHGWGKDKWDRDDKDSWKCFKLALPVSFTMPDGSTVTVESDDEQGWAGMKAWYEANPDSKVRPAMQYPVDVSLDDNTTITVNSDEDMKGLYRRCGGRKDDDVDACFWLVYPITFIMPDGSAITVDDKEDWEAVKNWYEENSDSEDRPSLQYPVDIKYRDGSIVTISNEEAMTTAKEDCGESSESDNMTQEVCEERGGTWTEASDRDGEYYCNMGG